MDKWYATAQRLVEEGAVLLKNDNNALPLGKEKIAVFGYAQLADANVSVTGRDIADALADNGREIDEQLHERYKAIDGGVKNYRTNTPVTIISNEIVFTDEEIREIKDNGAKNAVIVIARYSGENEDVKNEEGGYLLSRYEKKLIKQVSESFDKVVLILSLVGGIDLGFLDENKIDAIMYVSKLRDYGAEGVARLLCGDVNPSGKMTLTLAKHLEDYPSTAHFGEHGGGLVQDYFEDIFVGYRYFDTFDKHDLVVFPFGFGLSYTTFDIKLTDFEFGKVIKVGVDVTNTGKMSGKEVVQVYLAPPQLGAGVRLGRPKQELCGFEKTRLLSPGESEHIEICVNYDDLAAFDDTGILGTKSAWVLEKGTYTVLVGNSSVSASAAGEFTIDSDEVIRKSEHIETALQSRLLADGTTEMLPGAQKAAEYDTVISPTDENVIPSSVASVPFEELKCGEESIVKVLTGVGGYYDLTFDGDSGAKLEDLIEISFNGVVADIKSDETGCAKVTLPKCLDKKFTVICVKAKCDNPQITALKLKKSDTTVKIRREGKNVVNGHNFYECSYGLEIRSERQKEEIIDFLTWFWATGNNATYRLDVEEAGFYDISFKCRYSGETDKIGNVMSMAVSNISQPLSGSDLERVVDADGNNIFAYTKPVTIELPSGIAYLKFVVEKLPFPDMAEIIIEKSSAQAASSEDSGDTVKAEKAAPKPMPQIEPDDGVREGILLCDVYKNPSLMPQFLNQLSNRELATIVSGTGLNKTNHSNVGCNHPMFVRGIPAAQTADGCNGLYQPGVTTVKYSASILLASSFSRDMMREFGDAIGEECIKCEVDMWLAPAINIFRNPLGGRNYTYASEDPFVAAVFAIEQIKAVQKYGVVSMVKHYCANNTEYERLKSNSRVSERALREIYMKAFELAVREANPWAIMSSYNHVNNIKACEDKQLITDVPRNEWHWDGVFVTDWWNDSDHVSELKAGHDLKMATGDIDGVTNALDNGELSREQVYVSAERVLKMLMKITSVKQFLERELGNCKTL
jgi:beta-glucosidase-like glycosyl hydrolase